jgi:hypothetical protein
MPLSVLLTEFERRNENGGGVALGAGARRLRPIAVLEAVDAMYFLDSIGHTLRGVLPLAAVAAALFAILAVLPSAGRQRQQPRQTA